MLKQLEELSEKEKQEFSRICNRLLCCCFLSKQQAETKADFYFIQKYQELFEEYLGILGYRLEINEDYGIIQLTNPENFGHVNLKLYESIILLILRILYDEQRRQLSVTDEVMVTIGDIQDRFLALKLREKPIDRTSMRNALMFLRRFNLVELLDRKIENEDARVIVYDSILMAVRVENVRQVREKLEVYKRGETENEKNNEDEADQLV